MCIARSRKTAYRGDIHYAGINTPYERRRNTILHKEKGEEK
jgi:hypothetical protein